MLDTRQISRKGAKTQRTDLCVSWRSWRPCMSHLRLSTMLLTNTVFLHRPGRSRVLTQDRPGLNAVGCPAPGPLKAEGAGRFNICPEQSIALPTARDCRRSIFSGNGSPSHDGRDSGPALPRWIGRSENRRCYSSWIHRSCCDWPPARCSLYCSTSCRATRAAYLPGVPASREQPIQRAARVDADLGRVCPPASFLLSLLIQPPSSRPTSATMRLTCPHWATVSR